MAAYHRRCTSCGATDERRAFASRADAKRALDWTCARCGAKDTWELVKTGPEPA